MSADMLREAAALMRSRAEAATPGPWHTSAFPIEDGEGGEVVVRDRHEWEVGLMSSDYGDDGPHIASWHPAVALAVADWLEQQAARWDENFAATQRPGGFEDPGGIFQGQPEAAARNADYHAAHALAVARAYLAADTT